MAYVKFTCRHQDTIIPAAKPANLANAPTDLSGFSRFSGGLPVNPDRVTGDVSTKDRTGGDHKGGAISGADIFGLQGADAPAAKPAKVANSAPGLSGFSRFSSPPPVNPDPTTSDSGPIDQGDALNERAAIREFDGGIARAWAEGLARLDAAHPPADMPPARWLRFIDDAGRFSRDWGAKAEAMGWGPLEIFGADRRAPFGRLDNAGLVWLLNGRPVLALTEETAVIGCPGGVRQTYRRRPIAGGEVVLAWETVR